MCFETLETLDESKARIDRNVESYVQDFIRSLEKVAGESFPEGVLRRGGPNNYVVGFNDEDLEHMAYGYVIARVEQAGDLERSIEVGGLT